VRVLFGLLLLAACLAERDSSSSTLPESDSLIRDDDVLSGGGDGLTTSTVTVTGPSCTVPDLGNGKSGTGMCIDVSSCTGSTYSGFCKGASSIKCCVTSGALPTGISAIFAIAGESTCATKVFTSYDFKSKTIRPQGRLPRSYLRGVALSFAKQVCQPASAVAKFIGQPADRTRENDVLTYYNGMFAASNIVPGSGTNAIRAIYTLLYGLGMCESSGVYCTGRDMSSDFAQSDSAEAGLYQTSWGGRNYKPWNGSKEMMVALFNQYKSTKTGCYLGTYSAGITCSTSNLRNWGTGDGATFQTITKSCPTFAVEFAATLLRVSGGGSGEWNPIRKKYANVQLECYNMLGLVQTYIANNPSVCDALLTM